MKKFVVVSALLLVFILSGCGDTSTENNGLSGDTPPNVSIEIDGESYETILGSYCWDTSKGESECVDTAGPVDLLKDKEPLQIKAGEEIKLNMDYTLKPNKMHLSQIKNDDEMEIEVNDNQFTAPDEKGTYFYSYGVWWMDEEDEGLSHGDAFYAFSLEVK
ncbi:hypothetical protein [Bacillus sp. SD088]|uniref:hypothetical protein n=1 Tax=Bacillus sp. SD088 TaxID=2782012 RepID=UPI001A95B5C7|nr:hypothetical protein [Bacillus sp. SD088]MBO0995991.1 hypothetical protein [Bacillus sp. SD088]